jgi:hypothetical protein
MKWKRIESITRCFLDSNSVPKKIVCSEETLEAAPDPAVLGAVLPEPEVVEQLCWTLEMNNPVLLPLSERGDPDRDQPILTKR